MHKSKLDGHCFGRMSKLLTQWSQGVHNCDSTSNRPPFDSHSTTIRPRYDHSTTHIVGCCTEA